MIAQPGARGGLGVYVRLQVPQTQPFSFSPLRDALSTFLWILNSENQLSFCLWYFFAFPFNACRHPNPTGQSSRYRLQKMRGSFMAGCSTLPHPQQSQLSSHTDFYRPAGCLEASPLHQLDILALN